MGSVTGQIAGKVGGVTRGIIIFTACQIEELLRLGPGVLSTGGHLLFSCPSSARS